MIDDCNATKEDIRELRQQIDKIKANRYAPFLGSMGLFILIWAGLWASLRDVENEVDNVHIEIALALHQANEFRNRREVELSRHAKEHKREGERINRMSDFLVDRFHLDVDE